MRDGVMRLDGNYGGVISYEPNSFGGPVEDPSVKEPPLKISVMWTGTTTARGMRLARLAGGFFYV